MKPRVSDVSLGALLREGDPALPKKEVTDSERAAFEALLAALPQMALLRRRTPLVIVAGLAFSTLVGLGIWQKLPHQKSVTVAILSSPRVPTPSPRVPTPSPRVPTPSPRVPTPSPRVPTPYPSVPSPSPLVLASSHEPEAVITHVVIVADNTCRPGERTPEPEKITIRGDATSVIITTEPQKEQQEKEVSL